MNITKRVAVRIAISYGEIFDYPLTEEELCVWLPYIRHPLMKLHEGVLRKQKRLIAIRKIREAYCIEKWIRAREVVALLKFIPTITLVGVTGGLARSNAKANDDIDFFIITSSRTLWITRALSTILLDFVHLRRRPDDTNVRNLVCLNMFMSEDGLSVPKHERDLFSAHEVLLMTPLLDRNVTYKKFLSANRWVKTFLPNAWRSKSQASNSNVQQGLHSMLVIVIWISRFFEVPARVIQLSYMQRRRTSEMISDTVIRFHPRDARGWIKKKLGERLKRFNIPLDKIFYGR